MTAGRPDANVSLSRFGCLESPVVRSPFSRLTGGLPTSQNLPYIRIHNVPWGKLARCRCPPKLFVTPEELITPRTVHVEDLKADRATPAMDTKIPGSEAKVNCLDRAPDVSETPTKSSQ